LALALRWGAFGIGALAACCVTPYGWGSILASLRILGLGELLHLIQEWRPATFSEIDPFALVRRARINTTSFALDASTFNLHTAVQSPIVRGRNRESNRPIQCNRTLLYAGLGVELLKIDCDFHA
jgi:hypothetical protein